MSYTLRCVSNAVKSGESESILSSPDSVILSTTGNATNGYGVILSDPPWHWESWGKRRRKPSIERGATRYYETLTTNDLFDFPVHSWGASDCVLALWVINSMLPAGFELIDSWGFTFKTVGFVWIKTNKKKGGIFVGMGYHTRQNAELCLIATKGKPKRKSASVRQVIMSPRREHSRKPDDIYTRLESLYNGPYLDMFSRENREGWDAFGHQAGFFNER
tara:strand:+ start:271 stop:927 length:657 start_codon:yes stop_codon:yes gene_type:complete